MFRPHESIIGQKGGGASSVSSVFSDLAVPAGLFLAQQTLPLESKQTQRQYIRPNPTSINVIPSSLYDNLFQLAQHNPKTQIHKHKQTGITKKQTRKNPKENKNKNKQDKNKQYKNKQNKTRKS